MLPLVEAAKVSYKHRRKQVTNGKDAEVFSQ